MTDGVSYRGLPLWLLHDAPVVQLVTGAAFVVVFGLAFSFFDRGTRP